jgi:dTDP-4-dehydrorhamnose reductase
MSSEASTRPRILVFGGGGQLGLALAACRERIAPQAELIVMSRAEADITDAASVARAFETVGPSIVINAAAYTAVDRAETEEALAFEGNALGPHRLACHCAAARIPFFHISTDYVFSGQGDTPWREDDAPGPLNAYGRSKLAGEWAVLSAHPGSYIFRTSWVFSPWGNNFVKTMLRLGADRDDLAIVGDQHGCPTYAPDLADALLGIALALLNGESRPPGIHHFSNLGPTTWFHFASAIFEAVEKSGRRRPAIRPIPSSEYPVPAKRPAWSVLHLDDTIVSFGLEIPTWQDALDRCLAVLVAEKAENS